MPFELQLSAGAALLWMERLLGAALTLQTIELLLVRFAFSDEGVFRWATLRREYRTAPRLLRGVLDALLSYRPFVALLVLRLVAAVALPFCDARPLLPFLLLSTLLVCVRFRGTYNGGSDYMTVALLLASCVARLCASRWCELAGLAYAATQLTLSYFIAGLSKLREPTWRSGGALVALFASRQYARGDVRISPSARLAQVGALLVICFECAFPAAFFGAVPCLVLLAAAFVFHLVNAWLFGLNRFVWAWLAGYPALLHWSLMISG